jgi:hypothetical protein
MHRREWRAPGQHGAGVCPSRGIKDPWPACCLGLSVKGIKGSLASMVWGSVCLQVAPKSCGHVAGKQVVSREGAVARIRAAVDARQGTRIA